MTYSRIEHSERTEGTAPRVDLGQRAENFALASRVVAGDADAWEEFVRRYSGLILSVIRRYLHSRDRDEVRSLYADVLEALRRSKLRSFEGRSALSTWITIVTRTHVLDHLRRRFGQEFRSRAWRDLTPRDQRLFRFYYVEGLPATEVISAMSATGEPLTIDGFLAAIRRIEQQLGDRWLRRIAYDLHAQSIGASSGRLLEYLDHVRDEFQHTEGAHSPEYFLTEREARRMADRLSEILLGLPPAERRLLEMRFEKGWGAARIAEELGMARPRLVYSFLDRLVRKIRIALTGQSMEGS